MINLSTGKKQIVFKEDINEFIQNGYVFTRELKKFNNGIIEVKDVKCPKGFKPGKLPIKHTKEELEAIHNKRSLASKKRMQKLKAENRKIKPKEFTTKNMKWLYNLVSLDVVYAKPSEFDFYLKRNYVFGLLNRWWNNGKKEVFAIKCPDGFKPGKIKK